MQDALGDVAASLKKEADDLLHLRFLQPTFGLARPFGAGNFGRKAEAFARFFGTPTFLVGQTMIVGVWIALNASNVVHFDIYPFILLNLAFSLQAAYAAPLILLAQTRQADRDKALAQADAQHREALAQASLERQTIAQQQTDQLRVLLESNTTLTQENHRLTAQLERLTREIHGNVCPKAG